MIEEPRIKVKVGGRQFILPVFGDEDNTYDLAKQLQQRIEAIEEKSSRIDTQAFTIEAAMQALFDLQQIEETSDSNVQETMTHLKKLAGRVDGLVQEFQLGSKE